MKEFCKDCKYHRSYFDDGWDYTRKHYCKLGHTMNEDTCEDKDDDDSQSFLEDILDWLSECWFGIFCMVFIAIMCLIWN